MSYGPRPLLQVALDVLSTEEALRAMDAVYPHLDIVEIGTPLIIEEGLGALERLKEKYPDRTYLADLKIMDAGALEASSAFTRGADLVTVLAAADDRTIQGCLKAARDHGGQVVADLINVANPIERAKRLEDMGLSILCVHTAFDRQGEGINPLTELTRLRPVVRCRIAVAGGLELGIVAQAVSSGADVVVVGGGILKQPDPRDAAVRIMQVLER